MLLIFGAARNRLGRLRRLERFGCGRAGAAVFVFVSALITDGPGYAKIRGFASDYERAESVPYAFESGHEGGIYYRIMRELDE